MKPDLSLKKTAPLFERIEHIEGQRVPRHLILTVLLAAAFMFCDIFTEVVIGVPIIAVGQILGTDFEEPDAMLLLTLYLTPISIALTCIMTRLIEKRPYHTMLLEKRRMLPDYLTGAVLGFAMMSAVVFAAVKSGAAEYAGRSSMRSPVVYVLIVVGWIIQGFSEELTFRGWLTMSCGTYRHPWVGVIASALMFAAAHLGNDGISVFAFVNLTLFGVLMAVYVLRTRSIWGAAALHSVWNWAQGNFFGLQVSGIETGSGVFLFRQTGEAPLFSGGTFGLEAGLGTTIAVVSVLIILLLMPQREGFDRSV